MLNVTINYITNYDVINSSFYFAYVKDLVYNNFFSNCSMLHNQKHSNIDSGSSLLG